MSFNLLDAATFWKDVGDFFKKFGYDLYKFWINPDEGNPYILTLTFAIVFLVVGFFLIKLFIKLLRKIFKIGKKKFVNEKTVKNFIVNSINVVLNVLLVVAFLSILGVNLTGITTIFSSAILAVGLSLQDVISNFASGLIILSNKPFVVGDYVDLNKGECEGTVVDVKFLHTIFVDVDGQEIYCPNKNITSATIENYTRNPNRRININVKVDYSTDIDLIKKVLLEIVGSEPAVLKDPKPACYLTSIEEYSLNFSLRCFVPIEIYWATFYRFNELVIKKINENNIKIPFRKIEILDSNNKSMVLEDHE